MAKLFLVEDHDPLRRNLRDILVLAGHVVEDASDGADALSRIPAAAPDLVLCDILLPGMSGLEILAALRRVPATHAIPFIFLTAKGEPADVRAGMNLGSDDYLVKPVSRIDLLSAVQARLDRAAQCQSRPPDFSSPRPLEVLGLSPREAEVLLWIAQGKANHEIAIILGCSHATVKKHALHIFEKIGVETRTAALLVAIENLSSHARPPR